MTRDMNRDNQPTAAERALSRALPAVKGVGVGDGRGLSRSILAALLLAHQQAAPDWLVQNRQRGEKAKAVIKSSTLCRVALCHSGRQFLVVFVVSRPFALVS